MTKEDAALVISNAVQAVTIFGAVGKADVFELRGMRGDEEARRDLRTSLMVAAGISLATGLAVTIITDSMLPLVVNATVAAGMFVLLDRSLADIPPREERANGEA